MLVGIGSRHVDDQAGATVHTSWSVARCRYKRASGVLLRLCPDLRFATLTTHQRQRELREDTSL